MKSKLFFQMKQAIHDQALANNDNSDFVNVSVRPSPKIAAMLELVSTIVDKPISTMITDAISVKLAEHIRSTNKYQNQILSAVKEIRKEHRLISSESALGILIESGNLKISEEKDASLNPFSRVTPLF